MLCYATQAFRAVRMLKLLRVVRAARVFARWQTKNTIPYAKQSILVFIVFFLFLCHFFACLWLLVGRIERDSDSPNWIDFNLGTKLEVSWDDTWSWYLVSLHWSMMTVQNTSTSLQKPSTSPFLGWQVDDDRHQHRLRRHLAAHAR